MNSIYTIGHSQHSIEHFVNLLQMHGVKYVLDVRSTPYSKYAKTYDKGNISIELKKREINYSFMGKYFGARQEDKSLYTEEGYLDFEKVQKSTNFNIGLNNVVNGMGNNKIALMCLEKQPIDCHRAILVANAFYMHGVDVNHILENGNIETHNELNNKILDLYFPDRNQMSFFDTRLDKDYLEEAYRLRNRDIGYHVNEGAVI